MRGQDRRGHRAHATRYRSNGFDHWLHLCKVYVSMHLSLVVKADSHINYNLARVYMLPSDQPRLSNGRDNNVRLLT